MPSSGVNDNIGHGAAVNGIIAVGYEQSGLI